MSGYNEMKQLKNGSEVPESLVLNIMISLKDLMKGGLASKLAFSDLVDYCRNGNKITGRSRDILMKSELMNEYGEVHDAIRDVVLSAVQGEGYNISLDSPYAE